MENNDIGTYMKKHSSHKKGSCEIAKKMNLIQKLDS